MSFTRRFLAIAAMAAFSVFACTGCHSKSQQQAANSPNASSPNSAQSAQNPQQASAPSGAPSGSQDQGAPPAPQAPPPPAMVTLPAGTDLRVRLDSDLGSKVSRAGDSFTATVADDVVSDGQVVIPRGAQAEGTVIDAKPLGRFKGGAALAVRLERVTTRWGSYPVATSTISRAEKGKGKRTAVLAGGGAGLGALIGGLAGGGKGALIGALAGGGAGTAGSAFTGNKEIFLPAETLLTFHLNHSVHITEGRQ
jgi:glucose/arabinose dehydrogenase